MKLRDKFDNPIMRHDLCRNETEETKEQLEQIADDYAIEFAEWLYKFGIIKLTNGNWIIKLGLKPYTLKEVLEIFKKEKGL